MHSQATHQVTGQNSGPGAELEPIAIVGMAGRFPGVGAEEDLWSFMMDGGDAIRPVPAERWDASQPLDPERAVQAVGAFLDDVDLFDAGFFGVSPREAEDLDPQQRLVLETSWRALEDAGQRAADLAGSRTGVYVGCSWHDYETLRAAKGVRSTQHSLVGSALDVIAARVSYTLKLRGPSLNVETGCSSSLVALHLAVQALRTGEVEAALVAGSNLILAPDVTVGLTHFGGLSPDGRCAAFSAAANGFVRGEGVAVVYLKTLRRAVADGDRVHGVIVRTAVNNDNDGDSLVQPSQAGEEDLLRLAYGTGDQPGDIPADSVAYLEAHGTGTGKGDPIEATAVGRVLGARRAEPLPIGSAKTNLGHLEASAGMAGLFKLLLSLRHGIVPPSRMVGEVNPEIPFGELNVRVLHEPLPLPSTPFHLGLSSFGWGGTNAHVVLAGGLAQPAVPAEAGRPGIGLPPFVPVSARDRASLGVRAGELARLVPDQTTADATVAIAALAGTLAWHRDQFSVRAAVLATDPDELRMALRALADQPADQDASIDLPSVLTGPSRRPGRIAFVFPGQGSQWIGMGRELYRDSPVFTATVERCALALRPLLPADLLDFFTGDDAEQERWLARIELLQPVSWAMSLGLAELWRAAGVRPDVVLGHSQGEVAAATFAGLLSYADAATVIARRSAIARRTCGRGLMLAVDLDREAALAALEGFEDGVSLAVHNGPGSCVLSGDTDQVLMLKELLDAEGVFCRLVNVDYASHSPQMDELRDDLLEALAGVSGRPGEIAMHSTVRSRSLTAADLTADYWAENLRQPVLFADALNAVLDQDVTHLIEVSPHPVLTTAIERTTAARPVPAAVLSTLRRGQGCALAATTALARAYVSGLEPFGGLPADQRVDVPGYPFDRKRYWAFPQRARAVGAVRGFAVDLAPAPGEADTWQGGLELTLADQPWLGDHQVHDAAVLPATAMLAVALAAARSRTGSGPAELTEVRFLAGIPVTADGPPLTARWSDDVSEGGSFSLLSLPPGSTSWVRNASARIRYRPTDAPDQAFPAELTLRPELAGAEFYPARTASGLRYGPAFQGVTRLQRGAGGDEVLALVELAEGLRAGIRPGLLHPALWDGGLQAGLDLLPGELAQLPTRIRRIQLRSTLEEPVTQLWSHAVRRADGELDVSLFDGERRLLMTLEGLRFTPLPAAGNDTETGTRMHRIRWHDLASAPAPQAAGGWVVIGTGTTALELQAALPGAVSIQDAAGPAAWLRPDVAGVVFVAPDARQGLPAQRAGLLALTEVVRACVARPGPPRLVVVTAVAQPVLATDQPDPGAALYWGYGRVLRREHGELDPALLDVDPADPDWAAHAAAALLALEPGDDQVAVRAGHRRAAGIVRGLPDEEPGSGLPPPRTPPQPFRIGTRQPGRWEQLAPFPLELAAPGPDEVQIEVRATGLNFIDVMKALGTYPDPEEAGLLGGECAGVVVATGSDVTGLLPGDRVVGCGFGALASHHTVLAGQVRRIPAGLTDAEAAGLPLVLATAWYGLHDLAQVQPGETVLVHSAAGGVGLAAVRIATLLGARVIATAGSPGKREYLNQLGILDVFDSRELGWADQVREVTGGRGVDVVLNSLTGAALGLGLDLLADDGRFVELGKKDIYAGRPITLDPFRKSLSLFAVDLAGLIRRSPHRFGRILDQVWELVADRRIGPLPVATYPFADVAEGLRHLSHGQHIGKVVIENPATVGEVSALPQPGGRFRADGSYLVSGGLGALGLSVAEHLAAGGAGALILLGRSGPSGPAADRLTAIRAAGTEVRVLGCDVADQTAVAAALAAVRPELPPLRGVIHAAGVLADATLSTLDAAGLETVLAPKIDGARILDALTGADPLDFFCLFSSAAALTGNAGQAGYAAANAYLDALAAARRLRGRPGLSVQWGPFADTGLAAADANRGARLAERGMGSIGTAEAWPALELMLAGDEPVVGYVPIDVRRWLDAYPETAALRSWQWLRDAAEPAQAGTGGEFLRQLGQTSGEQRASLVETKVRELSGRVLRLDPARVERETPFKELGMDSLMSLELRNRLESAFGLKLSPTLLWTYGNPRTLAGALCERLPEPVG